MTAGVDFFLNICVREFEISSQIRDNLYKQ